MRRSLFLGLAASLLIFAAGLVVWRLAASATVLRVAVGPAASEDARLVAASAAHLVREQESIKFKILPVADEAEAAKALDDGRADLAVVRTDVAMPAKAQSVAVMHRDVAVLVTLPRTGIVTVAALGGRKVGIVKPIAANRRFLSALLGHYEVRPDPVDVVALDGPADVEPAFRAGRIDAALAVGTISGQTVTDTVAAATQASDGAPPVFVPVSEAEAIAQRSSLYEAFDLVRGVFGGTPPRPSEGVKTLSVDHRLVASTALEDSTVSELTRLLFAMRPEIAREVPIANRIEAPDTSRSSSLPVHPGANAYYQNEVETFFERYSDWIYLGAMGLSVVGSGLAGLASRASSRRRARTLGLLGRLHAIVGHVREAEPDGLADLEREADDILGVALAQAGTGQLDGTGIAAFSLGLDQVRHAISERRRLPPSGTWKLEVAAE